MLVDGAYGKDAQRAEKSCRSSPAGLRACNRVTMRHVQQPTLFQYSVFHALQMIMHLGGQYVR